MGTGQIAVNKNMIGPCSDFPHCGLKVSFVPKTITKTKAHHQGFLKKSPIPSIGWKMNTVRLEPVASLQEILEESSTF